MQRQGLTFGFAAYLMWGAFPLFFPLLNPAGTTEVLASRIAFSALATGILLLATRRLRRLTLGPGVAPRLGIASVLIAVNWGTYIHAVDSGRVVEAALGYFINPLVTVALGVLVLHERLRRAQWAALGLGVLAIVVISVSYGRPPWLALILAGSFGSYALAKKQVRVPALEGLFVEASILTLPATGVLIALAATGRGTFAGHGAGHPWLLVAAGPVTAVPLLAFAGAARRLPLTTIGMLQYLTPTLQLAVGVGIRHESLPGTELVGFVIVWIALIVLSVDGWRRRGGAPQVVLPLDVLVSAG